MKIRAVVFEFIVSRQTDRQTQRRTLFYNMYRYNQKLYTATVSPIMTYALETSAKTQKKTGKLLESNEMEELTKIVDKT